MSGITDEYKKEKIKEWQPTWSPDTINSWTGTQLEQIYRKEQQKIVEQIMLFNNVVDYRTS